MAQKPRLGQTRLRVVFDTNIYVSAILFGGAPRLCLEAARNGECELVSSSAILLELARVLREKFRWSEQDIAEVIVGLGKFTTIAKADEKFTVIKDDPSDNKVVEAAVEAKANFIVSGDKQHILPLKKFQGITIFTAAEFLKEL